MKAIIKISQASFGKFKLHVIAKKPNDYYSQPHANAYRLYQQDDFKDVQAFERFMTFARNFENFPFNFYTDPAHPQHFNQRVGMWCGYYIDHAKQLYAYRTCAGNFWGVYKDPKSGECFAFAYGARAMATQIAFYMNDDEKNSTPVLLETNAPKDMRWYERQADYLIRKGEDFSAKYFAKKGGVDDDSQNERDVFNHFVRKNPSFESIIHQFMFEHESPEQYILNKYRHKKIKPETLEGKDLTAWNLLDTKTQERILRWQ